MTKVAILGAGSLAWALAGDLLLRVGETYFVTVWAPPRHRANFNQVATGGFLKLSSPITGEFFPTLERDLGKAISSADFIVVVVPTLGHAEILNFLAEHDLKTSVLIVLPGNGFTLSARRLLRPELSPKAILETSTAPYACRRTDNIVAILGLKAQIEIAASKELSTSVKVRVASIFPGHLHWYQDLASIFFSNINPVAHPAGLLQAKEAVGSGIRPLPLFYGTFVASAIDVVLAVDNERLAIAKALNLQAETDFDYSKKWYGMEAPDPKTFYQTFDGYTKITTPETMNHRYLEEDVKYTMVLWVEIASVCGLKVPIMESVLDQASAVLNENLRETGRTLRSLGLTCADKDMILRALNGIYDQNKCRSA